MKAGLAAFCLIAGCTAAPRPLTEAQLQTYPTARGMPADVQDVMVRWLDCDHWLGEEPYDEARGREIDRAIRKVCPGIDAYAARIRARYTGNAGVLARIQDLSSIGQ